MLQWLLSLSGMARYIGMLMGISEVKGPISPEIRSIVAAVKWGTTARSVSRERKAWRAGREVVRLLMVPGGLRGVGAPEALVEAMVDGFPGESV